MSEVERFFWICGIFSVIYALWLVEVKGESFRGLFQVVFYGALFLFLWTCVGVVFWWYVG